MCNTQVHIKLSIVWKRIQNKIENHWLKVLLKTLAKCTLNTIHNNLHLMLANKLDKKTGFHNYSYINDQIKHR